MLSRLVDASRAPISPVVWPACAVAAGPAPPPPAPGPDLESAFAALERQVQEARHAGLREGEAIGRRQAEDAVRQAVERLAAAIADVASTRGDIMTRASADVVRLSLEIARRVLHRELSTDPAAVEALARAALEKLGSQEIYRIRVHPAHESLLRSALSQARSAAVEIAPDPSLSAGAVVFDTAAGSLDASVHTQLAEIERGLADQLGGLP